MTQRSTAQSKIDDRAFPIRVKFAVPSGGLDGRPAAMHIWLRDHAGRDRFAIHSAQAFGSQAVAVYFLDLAIAARFCEAFPDLAFADGTRSGAYYSPAKAAMEEKDSMGAQMMAEAAAALADRLQRSLANPATEHIILTREEAALAKGLLDGLRELLEREAGR